VAAGARLLTGGRPLDGPGSYYPPTVLAGVPLDSPGAVEEVFDVQVLAGQRFPEVLGFHKETVQHTFVVPSETPPIEFAPQPAVQQCPKGNQS